MDNLKLGLLFMFQGVVALVSTLFAFNAHAYAYEIPLGGFVLSGVYIWVGKLLRRREPNVRFFALGPCLLMVIGAFIVPLMALASAGAVGVLAGISSTKGWVGSPVVAMFFAVVASVYAIVMGVFGYRGLKYLRSEAGRHDFAREGVDRTAKFPHESVGIVIASAVVAIVFAMTTLRFDFSVRRSMLPGFLQTAAMTKSEAIDEARRNERVGAGAMFTADSRHIVVLPSEQQPKFLVIDLDTGKMRRVAADVPREGFSGQMDVAIDGSSILLGKNWLSLDTGKSRRVEAVPVRRHIGFTGGNRFLVYDEARQRLELIDLERGAAIYSLDVPVSERGDPNGNNRGWSMYSQVWSPDRRRYFWLSRDGVLNDLDVATGRVTKLPCPQCKYAGFQYMASTGDALLFVGNMSVDESSPTTTRGFLYRPGRREFENVDYRGRPIALGGAGRFVLFQQHNTQQISWLDTSSSVRRQWALDVPRGAELNGIYGDRWFSLHVRDEWRGRKLIGNFETPQAGKQVQFMKVPLALDYAENHTPSPDGRYLLYVAGAKIEVVDLHELAAGKVSNRTMDLLADEELEREKPRSNEEKLVDSEGKLMPPFVARWQEVAAPEPAPEPTPDPAAELYVDSPGSSPVQGYSSAQGYSPAQLDVPIEVQAPPVEERAPPTNVILKCVDAAGKVGHYKGQASTTNMKDGKETADTHGLAVRK